MKKICMLIASSSFMLSAMSQIVGSKKQKVMILGVFHFVSNNDAIKLQKEDMLSEKKQREIEKLNKNLLKFTPDRIFIEFRPQDQSYVDSTYSAFHKGKFKLGGNEVYQIAYKLAHKLNHTTVYCMDAPGAYRFDTLVSTAKQYGQWDEFEKHYKIHKAKVLKEDSSDRLLTVGARIRKINKPQNIMASHIGNASVLAAPYLGKIGEYGGAEFMGEWYKRNIRMYTNIVRSIKPSDKAILIIVGMGHARIIQHFFEDNPAFQITSPLTFLK